jgi:hypothetical protein
MSKKKPTRAEREAIAAFDALQRKWAAVPKFSRTHGVIAKPSQAIPALTAPPGRSTGREHKSLDTGFNGGTKPIVGMKYTGTKMLGIGVMHKSNSVPVFSQDEAIEISTMRRG